MEANKKRDASIRNGWMSFEGIYGEGMLTHETKEKKDAKKVT
jgi:hypothetical protein